MARLTEAPRREPDGTLRDQALIDREVPNINHLEAGIRKLLEGHR